MASKGHKYLFETESFENNEAVSFEELLNLLVPDTKMLLMQYLFSQHHNTDGEKIYR